MSRLRASAVGLVAGSLLFLPLAIAGPAAAAPEPQDTQQACPEGEVPEDGFDDVPDSNVHESAIDCAVHNGLAVGRTRELYAPEAPVTRGQLASFVLNLLHSNGEHRLSSGGDRFVDDENSVHENNINTLAESGIVSGRTQTAYDPDGLAGRDQVAAVLVRAIEYRTDDRLAASADYFTDDDGSVHEDAINAAAEAGLVTGTSEGRYEPGRPVQRDQLASMLVRAFDLLTDKGYGGLCPQEYPPYIRIDRVEADPPGDDLAPGAGEYVELRSDWCENVPLDGWHLRDDAGNVIRIADGYLLRPQQTMRVYTGPGSRTEENYYAGRDTEVWDNAGDTATLYAPEDAEADRFSY